MDEILTRLRLFAVQTLAVVIDSAFVGSWVILHTWFENNIASHFRLTGLHAYTFNAFQGIFAISTFFPVAVYVVVDLACIYKKAKASLAREVNP